MFKTRLLSGIVLVIIAALLIILGGDVLLIGTLAISLIGMMELYRIFGFEKSILASAGYASAVLYYVLYMRLGLVDSMFITTCCMTLIMFVYVFTYPKYHAKQVMAAFFGFVYVAVMLSYVYQIRRMENGAYLTVLIFLCSWGCDTCAYCVGVLFGKHKMAPVLSPKKSIEGAVGGVAGVALLTALYTYLLRDILALSGLDILLLSIFCAVAGLVSMVGDLTASAIKRNYEIKDYGTLIPGHGGILDRFDSMIITAPIIYYIAFFLLSGRSAL